MDIAAHAAVHRELHDIAAAAIVAQFAFRIAAVATTLRGRNAAAMCIVLLFERAALLAATRLRFDGEKVEQMKELVGKNQMSSDTASDHDPWPPVLKGRSRPPEPRNSKRAALVLRRLS